MGSARTGSAVTAAAAAEAATGGKLSRGILPTLLGYRLRRAQTAVFRSFAHVVGAAEDITPGLFGMAQVIAANPGLCQSRLAEVMGVDRSTIVLVIRRLEARGLVERRRSPGDLRSHSLYVTPEGRRALRRIERLILRHEEEIASVLSAAERRTLMRLLARLYERDREPVARRKHAIAHDPEART